MATLRKFKAASYRYTNGFSGHVRAQYEIVAKEGHVLATANGQGRGWSGYRLSDPALDRQFMIFVHPGAKPRSMKALRAFVQTLEG